MIGDRFRRYETPSKVPCTGAATMDTTRRGSRGSSRSTPTPRWSSRRRDRSDVQAAIRTARDGDLPFAVQSTGHGAVPRPTAGCCSRRLRWTASPIDPERRVARVAAGTTWDAVIAAAAPHGLAPLSGSSPTVGVVGYTLGGGTGWLSRKYGYAADSVLRAAVVTADGELVTASADEHPDLFWALRGGGGNFGVVTELEFRLYPVGPALRRHGDVRRRPRRRRARRLPRVG